jgi:chromosome partitioning protein
MPLVVIASGKGGVTKTTTAYALAAALREQKKEPVLLDLDPGASLTENAGLIADGRHALDFLEGNGTVESLSATTQDGTPLIPGTAALLEPTGKPELKWAKRLKAYAADQLIVVDTAQGLALPATRAAILAADFIIIPMQAEPAVIKRSYPDVLGLVRALRKDAAFAAEFPLKPRLLFVMTKHNGRLALARHQLNALAEEGVKISAYVPTAVAAAEACLAGRSIVTFAPKSPVAQAYRALARELVAEMNSQKLNAA